MYKTVATFNELSLKNGIIYSKKLLLFIKHMEVEILIIVLQQLYYTVRNSF